MRRWAALVTCAIALTSSGGLTARADKNKHADAKAHAPLPAELHKLLAAHGKAGKAVIGKKQRQYLRSLPSHIQKELAATVKSGMIGSAKHAQVLLSLALPARKLSLLLHDNCVLCHSNPDEQDTDTLFTVAPPKSHTRPKLDLAQFVDSVHFRRGLSCSGCHGGTPDVTEMVDAIGERWPDDDVRKRDKSWIPKFCAHCHANPTFMRQYAPKLPTDQLAKYKTSRHGVLVLEKHDPKPAQCVSCHGSHGILGPKSPKSSVNALHVAETCGHCHGSKRYMAGYTVNGKPIPTDQLSQYRLSVHGRALYKKHDLGAPTCNDCHGNHAAMPPKVSSVAQICRTCHQAQGDYFDGSKHKQAFERHNWPECVKCHGKHDIHRLTDAVIGARRGNLCHDCHTVNAKGNPRCDKVAAYFGSTLHRLAGAQKNLKQQSVTLAEKALDVDPLQAQLSALKDALLLTRTRVHSFDRSTFGQSAGQAEKSVKKARALVVHAHAEFRTRERGLIAAIGIMALLAIGLFVKLRRMERTPDGAGSDAAPGETESERESESESESESEGERESERESESESESESQGERESDEDEEDDRPAKPTP